MRDATSSEGRCTSYLNSEERVAIESYYDLCSCDLEHFSPLFGDIQLSRLYVVPEVKRSKVNLVNIVLTKTRNNGAGLPVLFCFYYN